MYETPRLLRLPDVQRLTGLSKSSIYRLEARNQFPSRLRLSQRTIAFRESEVVDWINARASVALLYGAAEPPQGYPSQVA